MNSPSDPKPFSEPQPVRLPTDSGLGGLASPDGRAVQPVDLAVPGSHFPLTADVVAVRAEDPWAVPSQVFSWIVIIFCTGLMMWMVFASQFLTPPEQQSTAGALVQANLAGQMALGMEPFDRGQARQMLDGLDSGPVPQRLARIILYTEFAARADVGPELLKGPPQELQDLHEKIQAANYTPTEEEQKLIDATAAVVMAKSVSEPLGKDSEAVQTLEQNLGFAGQVAASWSSDDPKIATRLRDNSTAKLFGVGIFFFLVLAAAGLGLFVGAALVACWLFGLLRTNWLRGSGYGYLHLEAFAVWFACFIVAQFGVGLLMVALKIGDKGGAWLTLVAFYVPALIALTWLVVRHPQPWLGLREVGFTGGNVFVDLGKAIVTHLAFLPLLGLMMLLTVGLTSWVHGGTAAEHPFAPPGGPSHPIQEQFDGNWGTVVMLFLLAAVTAPLVEETVFRGLLYRYLRDVTQHNPVVWSVLIATLVNGFIFASIHPQGLLGIPPLMTLAASMSIAREWSGGLLAPMAIHALNNGALVILMSVLFAN
jgi:membrane protease YdiL (CAAX protease family)